MRLAQSDSAVDKEWVIGDTWMFRHLQCCRTCKLICLSGNERVERERRVEPRLLANLWFRRREFICALGNFNSFCRHLIDLLTQIEDYINPFAKIFSRESFNI